MKLGDLAKKMGEDWRCADPKNKEKYEKMAAAEKERYEKEK